MPLRVAPNQVSERGKHSSILVPPNENDVPIEDDLKSDQQNINGQLLKTIDELYRPVLNLMALFGTYFGNTSLKYLQDVPARKKKRGYLSGVYCVVVASGFWLSFIMSVVDVFLGENLYLYTLFSLWTLLIALSATICLIVLCVPLGDSRKSQFENFLRNLLAINSNVGLEKVKRKAKKGIITFCFFFILGAISVLISYKVLDTTIADVTPWKQWFGFTILSLIFFIYGMGVWLLPVIFVCVTCLILEALFDDLHKQMSSFHTFPVDIGTFKKEHCRLCEIVEFADKVLAPLLFGLVSLYIPFICFEFYALVNPPKEHEFTFLISNVFWLASAAGILTVIMAFGTKVNEKVNSMETILVCTCKFKIGFKLNFLAEVMDRFLFECRKVIGFTSLHHTTDLKKNEDAFLSNIKRKTIINVTQSHDFLLFYVINSIFGFFTVLVLVSRYLIENRFINVDLSFVCTVFLKIM